MRDISYRVALGGIVSALCLVTMFLAGVLPALYLVLPMTAGMLLLIIAEEVSIGWSFLTYISVSLLSLIITFDKEASLIFIMLFGHYPILRLYIQRIKLRLPRTLLKLAVFNFCVISYFYVTVYLLGVEGMLDDFDFFGKYAALVVLVICNLIFIMYDFCLMNVYSAYKYRVKPKFRHRR